MVNILQNGDFSVGPAMPVVLVGLEDKASIGAAGPAPGWFVWNNGYKPVIGDAIWTSATVQNLADVNFVLANPQVVSSFKDGPGGIKNVNIAEVRTNSGWDGLYQFFDFVPGAHANLWVFVIEGGCYAALGESGTASASQNTSTMLQWEQIDFTIAQKTNEFVVYSPEKSGAWFFVAQVVVEALEPDDI